MINLDIPFYTLSQACKTLNYDSGSLESLILAQKINIHAYVGNRQQASISIHETTYRVISSDGSEKLVRLPGIEHDLEKLIDENPEFKGAEKITFQSKDNILKEENSFYVQLRFCDIKDIIIKGQAYVTMIGSDYEPKILYHNPDITIDNMIIKKSDLRIAKVELWKGIVS